MIWKPHVTVAAIIESNRQFLMVEEHSSDRLVINQPAGHLDADESLLQAVIRETLEETAWDIRPEYVTGIYRWTNPASAITYIRVCFAAQALGHDAQRELDEGIIQAIWMSYAEINNAVDRLRSPMVLRGIDDYLAGRRYPLELFTDIT